MVRERDYLKQELGMFLEQIGSLEKENAALSQELQERRETDEFKSLEEEFRKEHEVKMLICLHSDSTVDRRQGCISFTHCLSACCLWDLTGRVAKRNRQLEEGC